MERRIRRKLIQKQVKKEFELARKWCKYDSFSRYYKMMIDTSDGDIWSDCFLSTETWHVYHSDTIVSLSAAGALTVKEKESEYIADAIRELENAGWAIVA